jgi:hypothetical protein
MLAENIECKVSCLVRQSFAVDKHGFEQRNKVESAENGVSRGSQKNGRDETAPVLEKKSSR